MFLLNVKKFVMLTVGGACATCNLWGSSFAGRAQSWSEAIVCDYILHPVAARHSHISVIAQAGARSDENTIYTMFFSQTAWRVGSWTAEPAWLVIVGCFFWLEC